MLNSSSGNPPEWTTPVIVPVCQRVDEVFGRVAARWILVFVYGVEHAAIVQRRQRALGGELEGVRPPLHGKKKSVHDELEEL